MAISRVTQGVTFNTGISNAEYNQVPAGQTPGHTQGTVLPGSTTVTEALDSVFPREATLDSQIMARVAAEGNSILLRSANGFHFATKKAIQGLKKCKSKAGDKAAKELEELLADTELLDQYRASLLES